MLSPVLNELIDYFAPLSTLHREENGAVTLLTPGVNVLGLNATYLPEVVPNLRPALAWHKAHGQPPLLASPNPVAGAREVAALEVGTFMPTEPQGSSVPDSGVMVEQISRLHMQEWADVLTAAHGTPQWATPLARHLAARLEGRRDYLPLLAYDRADEAVGALLWSSSGGGAAHLWGASNAAAAVALLTAAAALGQHSRVSLPTSLPLRWNVGLDQVGGVKFLLAQG